MVEDISDKYENSLTLTQVAFSSSGNLINGLFEDKYTLTIGSINSSDSGIYFCQISADGFCFIPSAYVNIIVNTGLNGNGCSSVTYQRSPVCALNNPSSCQVIPTSSIHIMSSTPSILNMIMSSTPLSTSPVKINTPSATPTQLELCHGKPDLNKLGFVACLGVTVPAAGFTLILMIILICCAGICICWRKKTRRKGESKVNGFGEAL